MNKAHCRWDWKYLQWFWVISTYTMYYGPEIETVEYDLTRWRETL
jgi:hypothetical protein